MEQRTSQIDSRNWTSTDAKRVPLINTELLSLQAYVWVPLILRYNYYSFVLLGNVSLLKTCSNVEFSVFGKSWLYRLQKSSDSIPVAYSAIPLVSLSWYANASIALFVMCLLLITHTATYIYVVRLLINAHITLSLWIFFQVYDFNLDLYAFDMT